MGCHPATAAMRTGVPSRASRQGPEALTYGPGLMAGCFGGGKTHCCGTFRVSPTAPLALWGRKEPLEIWTSCSARPPKVLSIVVLGPLRPNECCPRSEPLIRSPDFAPHRAEVVGRTGRSSDAFGASRVCPVLDRAPATVGLATWR
jgi:hypothetical protein